MSKWNILGGLCLAASATLLLFQSVGKLVHENYDWKMLSLVDVVKSRYLEWIDRIQINYAHQAADFIVNMPLYQLLFAIGVLFFIFSMFSKGK